MAEIIRESIEDAMQGRSYVPTEKQQELIQEVPVTTPRWYLKLKEAENKAAS